MEHIAVGFDGTDPAFVAVDWAAERAARGSCRIELVTVDREDPFAEPGMDVRDASRRILDRSPTAETATRHVSGRMPEALLHAAETADLLVIGAHRRRPVRSAISGWLPLRTVSRTTVPTVVISDDWTASDGTILVGIDDDDSSTAAVEFAAAEAAATGSTLTLMHAWRMPGPSKDSTGALTASATHFKALGREILEEAADLVAEAHPALTVEKVLVQDNPSSALVSRSARATLLVLGTHHRGPVAGAILGSVCQDALWRSHAPVCVVPATSSAG